MVIVVMTAVVIVVVVMRSILIDIIACGNICDVGSGGFCWFSSCPPTVVLGPI